MSSSFIEKQKAFLPGQLLLKNFEALVVRFILTLDVEATLKLTVPKSSHSKYKSIAEQNGVLITFGDSTLTLQRNPTAQYKQNEDTYSRITNQIKKLKKQLQDLATVENLEQKNISLVRIEKVQFVRSAQEDSLCVLVRTDKILQGPDDSISIVLEPSWGQKEGLQAPERDFDEKNIDEKEKSRVYMRVKFDDLEFITPREFFFVIQLPFCMREKITSQIRDLNIRNKSQLKQFYNNYDSNGELTVCSLWMRVTNEKSPHLNSWNSRPIVFRFNRIDMTLSQSSPLKEETTEDDEKSKGKGQMEDSSFRNTILQVWGNNNNDNLGLTLDSFIAHPTALIGDSNIDTIAAGTLYPLWNTYSGAAYMIGGHFPHSIFLNNELQKNIKADDDPGCHLPTDLDEFLCLSQYKLKPSKNIYLSKSGHPVHNIVGVFSEQDLRILVSSSNDLIMMGSSTNGRLLLEENLLKDLPIENDKQGEIVKKHIDMGIEEEAMAEWRNETLEHIVELSSYIGENEFITKVTGSRNKIFILTNNGNVYHWGLSVFHGNLEQLSGKIHLPIRLEGIESARQIKTSNSHHSVITTDNKLLQWGFDLHGNCSCANVNDEGYAFDLFPLDPTNAWKNRIPNPILMEYFKEREVFDVAVNDSITCCLTMEGEVYVCGSILVKEDDKPIQAFNVEKVFAPLFIAGEPRERVNRDETEKKKWGGEGCASKQKEERGERKRKHVQRILDLQKHHGILLYPRQLVLPKNMKCVKLHLGRFTILLECVSAESTNFRLDEKDYGSFKTTQLFILGQDIASQSQWYPTLTPFIIPSKDNGTCSIASLSLGSDYLMVESDS